MLSQIERGESMPTLPLAERIALVLDTSVGELLEGEMLEVDGTPDPRSTSQMESPMTTRRQIPC